MTLALDTGGARGAARTAAPLARAHATVGDYRARQDAERHAVAGDADRYDAERVEHMRQSRLKRWQTPPTPNRTKGLS